MKNTMPVLRIALTFLCIIALFSYGVFTLFFKVDKDSQKINYSNAFSPFSFESAAPVSTSATIKEAVSDNREAVTAGAGEVEGKIVNKTVSGESANIYAGGVHIKNSTDLSVNAEKLLSSKLGFQTGENTDIKVLIVHTHATESFLAEDRDYYTASDLSRTTDNSSNVTRLGEIVAERLNAASIVAIHDKTQHDYPSYSGSYSRAAATIKSHLKSEPGIKVVIDIHRDAIQSGGTKTKLTAEIEGKRAAQIMLVMGSQSGSVKNFPNWQENLKLALRLQKNIEETYPALARPLSLMSRSYNQPLTTGSMLIEIGTDANTLSEATYSAELLSDALIKTLKGS